MADSFLDTDFAPLDDSFQATLIKWGNETMSALRLSLQKKVSNDTSKKLEQSIIVLPLQFQDNKYLLSFKAEDYWKFINSGVRGVGGENKSKGTAFKQKGGSSPFTFKEGIKPSAKHFDLWARTKGLNKYAVRESVFRQGIKPTHFFDEVVTPALTNDLIDRLEKSAAKEIEIVLGKSFKNGK